MFDRTSIKSLLAATATLISLVAVASCGQEELSPDSCTLEPPPTSEPGSPPSSGPPGLPYIFDGTYYVDGEPGPGGQKIYVKLTHSRSQPVTTLDDGRYYGVIHGPVSDADWEAPFVFCLGSPDGEAVPAQQTYEYENFGNPHTVQLDLYFPRLPEN